MGALIAFFAQLGQQSTPKRTKDQHLINVANLNYCGIMKSPFEFYSGKYQHDLERLSITFERLKRLYIPWEEGKPQIWQFSKLDKKIKDRYCPLYDPQCGIENDKFVTKKQFIRLWQKKFQEQEKLTQSKFGPEEKKQALIFDMLAFHTLLFHVYKILDIDQAVNLNVEEYRHKYRPFFQQSFLNEKRKLQQFKKGMNESMADIVFVQEPDQLLIDDLAKFSDKYFISISPDKDTLIFAKRERFNHEHEDKKEKLSRLTPEQLKLLNWNGHSSYMFLDDLFLISGHLNSKKAENQVNVKEVKTIVPVLLQKYPDHDIIIGMDANSYIEPFHKCMNMFPELQKQYTSIKKRTSMQVQSSKAEKLVEQNKDAIMTTLPIKLKNIFTINGKDPSKHEYLPLDEHPFDHYLVFAVCEDIKMKEKEKELEKKK